MAYADRAAQGEYQRQWNAARRAQAIAAAGGKCKRCGSTESLEFAGFKRLRCSWSWAPARLEAALAQCELVCRRCRIGSAEIRHGTSAGYDRHRCRCAECVEWRRLEGQRYRARRRAREVVAAPERHEAPVPTAKERREPAAEPAVRPNRTKKSAPIQPAPRQAPSARAASARQESASGAAPTVHRPPLPPSAERAAVWASVVAKMAASRAMRF